MLQVGMHEHVSDKLIKMKIRGKKEMKTKDIVQIYRSSAHKIHSLKYPHHQECHYVDNEKVLGYRWNTHHIRCF